jgi:adenine-specific DNA-methyltransferase
MYPKNIYLFYHFLYIDSEQAYLKVLMDEIFDRKDFIGSFIWKKKSGGGNDSKYIVN